MVRVSSPVRLIEVPFDSGHYGVRMGAGPLALARAGAARLLREQGHIVEERLLEPAPSWRAELATAFELQRLVAAEVATARTAGQVPLLLAGNCDTTVGMLADPATTRGRPGMVWFDAHGDFNTPEIDPGGFLDGHGLAMAVGRCWQALTSAVPCFAPLPENRVALIGARSFDEAEELALRDSSVTWLPPSQVRDTGRLVPAIEALTAEIDTVHLHIDLDVHDPSIAPANQYAAPDGLSQEEMHQVIREIADRVPVTSATVAAYDPAYDPESRMERTALDLLALVAGIKADASSLSNCSKAVRISPALARSTAAGKTATV
jgi:arginase